MDFENTVNVSAIIQAYHSGEFEVKSRKRFSWNNPELPRTICLNYRVQVNIYCVLGIYILVALSVFKVSDAFDYYCR